MKVSNRILTLTTLVIILNVAFATQNGVNPMMLSRNAFSQSVKRVSFGNRRSGSTTRHYNYSPETSTFADDNIYENGYDDTMMMETSSPGFNDNQNDVELCSVS